MTSTVYVNKYFEVREHDAPVKYVFNGSTRVARVTGSLSANVRVQRLRVYPGWNLCSLAVTATNALGQLSSGGAPVPQALYQWEPQTSNYVAVAVGQTLAQGTVLWLESSVAATLSVTGMYAAPANLALDTGGTFVSSAGLEAWCLSNALPATVTAWKPLPQTNGWQIQLPGPVQSLSDLPPFIAPGEAIFVQAASPALLMVPEAAAEVRFFHPDHLGSTTALTDQAGQLEEEMCYYAFGPLRMHAQNVAVQAAYKFIDKERDAESGLDQCGARFLACALGRFASSDPLGARVATARKHVPPPEQGNPYNYAFNNPLVVTDPTGLQGVSLSLGNYAEHLRIEGQPNLQLPAAWVLTYVRSGVSDTQTDTSASTDTSSSSESKGREAGGTVGGTWHALGKSDVRYQVTEGLYFNRGSLTGQYQRDVATGETQYLVGVQGQKDYDLLRLGGGAKLTLTPSVQALVGFSYGGGSFTPTFYAAAAVQAAINTGNLVFGVQPSASLTSQPSGATLDLNLQVSAGTTGPSGVGIGLATTPGAPGGMLKFFGRF